MLVCYGCVSVLLREVCGIMRRVGSMTGWRREMRWPKSGNSGRSAPLTEQICPGWILVNGRAACSIRLKYKRCINKLTDMHVVSVGAT